MTIRFFILQAHYRSTVDFSNSALKSSEKGLLRLFKGIETIDKIILSDTSSVDLKNLEQKCYNAINDDLNSPILISHLFDGIKIINSIVDGKEKINKNDLSILKNIYKIFVFDILGLKNEHKPEYNNQLLGNVVNMILDLRQEIKSKKDFETADKIRTELIKLGINVKDKKDGFEWEVNK
ncbi:MAG: hypothetical protein K8R67_11235 [Desulfobacteraceae bacterium]|nr:hypothetical protein [Desulfobacteraceae bacterium]